MKANLDPRLETITEQIIGAAFEVANTLGHGFLEAVYRNALPDEIELRGLAVESEKQYPVFYKGNQVGTYYADLVVAETVVVELKSVETLARDHVAQVINYLRASRLPVGLLLNFGTSRIQVRRVLPS